MGEYGRKKKWKGGGGTSTGWMAGRTLSFQGLAGVAQQRGTAIVPPKDDPLQSRNTYRPVGTVAVPTFWYCTISPAVIMQMTRNSHVHVWTDFGCCESVSLGNHSSTFTARVSFSCGSLRLLFANHLHIPNEERQYLSFIQVQYNPGHLPGYPWITAYCLPTQAGSVPSNSRRDNRALMTPDTPRIAEAWTLPLF
jgi:hypothetical protein